MQSRDASDDVVRGNCFVAISDEINQPLAAGHDENARHDIANLYRLAIWVRLVARVLDLRRDDDDVAADVGSPRVRSTGRPMLARQDPFLKRAVDAVMDQPEVAKLAQ